MSAALPTLEDLCPDVLTRLWFVLGVPETADCADAWSDEWDAYFALSEAFAESRRLKCPRCGEWLLIYMEGGDERNFAADCSECWWPGDAWQP